MAKPRLTASRPHNYEWVIKPGGHIHKTPTTFNVSGPLMVDDQGGVLVRDEWRKKGYLALANELPADKYEKFLQYQEECTSLRRRKKPAGWAEKWDIEESTGLPRDCIPDVVLERRGLNPAVAAEPEPPEAKSPPKPKDEKGGGSK